MKRKVAQPKVSYGKRKQKTKGLEIIHGYPISSSPENIHLIKLVYKTHAEWLQYVEKS